MSFSGSSDVAPMISTITDISIGVLLYCYYYWKEGPEMGLVRDSLVRLP